MLDLLPSHCMWVVRNWGQVQHAETGSLSVFRGVLRRCAATKMRQRATASLLMILLCLWWPFFVSCLFFHFAECCHIPLFNVASSTVHLFPFSFCVLCGECCISPGHAVLMDTENHPCSSSSHFHFPFYFYFFKRLALSLSNQFWCAISAHYGA